MTALHRKLLRDLWHLRGPAIAVGLVLACGVATFVMSLCTLSTLEWTQTAYYERQRFADIFVRLKRAPEALAARIAEIPGVSRIETRLVEFVNLDVPGMREPATGQLISVPDYAQPTLNGLYLRMGRWPDPLRPGEALVSDGFASAHGLTPGARVIGILNGRRQELTIVGIAFSPEFIYQIQEGGLLPDERRFGIFWLPRSALAAAFNLEGAFNSALVSTSADVTEQEILRRVDLLTEPYGGVGAYARSDQSSHKFISNEMNELRGMASVVPTIFLLVSGFLLQVIVSRLIGTQREQIAMLKAFGYRSTEIGIHYWQLVLIIAFLAWVLGMLAGIWFGRGIAEMYARFFHFPVYQFRLDTRVLIQALALSLGLATAASWTAVQRAMRLPPAEAMRPEAPANYRPTWLERSGIMSLATPSARMILRQIVRRPFRSAVTVTGLALSVAVLILGSFMVDALSDVISTEFFVSQRQDLTLSLVEVSSGRVISTLTDLPGVKAVESFRTVPVRIRAGHRSRRLSLMGLVSEPRLFRLVDIHRNVQPVPRKGVIVSEKLAETLAMQVGDRLDIEILEGERKTVRVPIVATISDFQGESVYTSLAYVHELIEEQDAVSGVFCQVDPADLDALYHELKTSPQLSNVALKSASLTTIRETIAANILRMRTFNVLFACIIACGVIYNSARISLAERSRDLATLRVLGFTRGEVSTILLGELTLLTGVAIPLGLAGGYWLADFVIRLAYDTELFRIPLVVARSTYAFAATTTMLAAAVSGWLVIRRLSQLDLVSVLKARE